MDTVPPSPTTDEADDLLDTEDHDGRTRPAPGSETPSEGVNYDPDILQVQLTEAEQMDVEDDPQDQQEQTGENVAGRKRKEEKRRQGGPK